MMHLTSFLAEKMKSSYLLKAHRNENTNDAFIYDFLLPEESFSLNFLFIYITF